MGRRHTWVLWFAWTAIVLPWERCHSDCHDRVLPALAAHACHEVACDSQGLPADGDNHAHHDDADHERVTFFSVAPTGPSKRIGEPAAPFRQAPAHAACQARIAARPAATVALLLLPPTQTVVLLL